MRHAVSTLPLFVLRIVANDHHLAFAADDFTFIANFFDGRTNLHILFNSFGFLPY
jgi:hypothetical protein